MKENWKRNASVFVLSQIISLFGSALVQYAITWHITLSTQSGVYATVAIVCGFVPTFLLSPFAGVWADRYNRKTLIMLADGAIAFTTLLLAIAFMLGFNYVWLLFLALAIRGLGAAVQTPCINALLPDIVPQEHYTRVNGINTSAQSLTQLASPMLAGVLLGMVELEYIFFIDVVTAAIAIGVLLLFLKIPQRHLEKTATANDYFGELRDGLRYIRSQKYLFNLFVLLAVFYVMVSPTSFLTPLQTVRVFGDDVWRLTAIEMAFALGMGAGGLGIAAWGGFKNRVVTMFWAVVAMGLCILGLAFPFNFALYLGVMALIGALLSMYNTPAVVLLQERVAPEYLGRVFSVNAMISTSMMPLGMLVFGPLADVVSIETLLLVSGAVVLLLAFFLGFNPALRAAGEPVAAKAEKPPAPQKV